MSVLIAAARKEVERFLRRALITQTFELTTDGFPVNVRSIDLPRPPLQSVQSIRYVDTAGNIQMLAPEAYVVDAASNEIGRVALVWNQYWLITRCSITAVVIRFVGSYGDAPEDVPQAIRQRILVETSNPYENREDIVVGQNISMVSLSERLLWPYRALGVE